MKISLYLSSEHSGVGHCERCIQIACQIHTEYQSESVLRVSEAALYWYSSNRVLLLLHNFLQFSLNYRTYDSLKWQIVARASRSSAPLNCSRDEMTQVLISKTDHHLHLVITCVSLNCIDWIDSVHVVLLHPCMLHVERTKSMHTASQIVISLQTWCFKHKG